MQDKAGHDEYVGQHLDSMVTIVRSEKTRITRAATRKAVALLHDMIGSHSGLNLRIDDERYSRPDWYAALESFSLFTFFVGIS